MVVNTLINYLKVNLDQIIDLNTNTINFIKDKTKILTNSQNNLKQNSVIYAIYLS